MEFYNKKRPSYSLGYDTLDNYYKRFRCGEIDRKDTFSKRELTDEPKFVQKKRARAAEAKQNQGIPASESSVSAPKNESDEKTSAVSTIN